MYSQRESFPANYIPRGYPILEDIYFVEDASDSFPLSDQLEIKIKTLRINPFTLSCSNVLKSELERNAHIPVDQSPNPDPLTCDKIPMILLLVS